jgi:hypothetical protein
MKMSNLKTRHNVMFSNDIWQILQQLKKVQGKSISELIETAILKMMKDDNYNEMYFKIMSTTSYCSDQENEELTSLLESLSAKDLEIAEEYEI